MLLRLNRCFNTHTTATSNISEVGKTFYPIFERERGLFDYNAYLLLPRESESIVVLTPILKGFYSFSAINKIVNEYKFGLS